MMKKIKEFLFHNKSSKQTITKNVFWLSVSQLAGRIIRSAIIIYAARVLGAAEYGVFSYALGLAGFFTIFADIGISVLLTKEVAQQPQKAKAYFAVSLWLKSILLLGTTLLIVFIAPYFSKIEQAKALLPFVALLVIFDNLREFSNAFFRAKEKMEFEALTTIFMNITITVLGFIALYFSKSAGAITFSYVGSAGAGFLAAIFILREEFLGIIKNFDKSLIRPILKLAWPIALSGLLGAFMLNVDIIMLGWFRTETEIGLYSAGQKIVQLLYILPSIIASAVFSPISRAVKNQEYAVVRSITEKSASLISLIALPLIVGGIVLGKPIIEFLYGNGYLNGVSSFQILILTILITFYGSLFSNLILAYDQQKKFAAYAGLASIGNIIFNAMLIPFWGIAGAAAATLIVQTMYYGLIWKALTKIIPFRIFPNVKKVAPTAAIMGLAAFLINEFSLNVIINIFISGMIYFIILYLLKETIIREIEGVFIKIKSKRASIN